MKSSLIYLRKYFIIRVIKFCFRNQNTSFSFIQFYPIFEAEKYWPNFNDFPQFLKQKITLLTRAITFEQQELLLHHDSKRTQRIPRRKSHSI